MEKQDAKFDLMKTNVAAKKRREDLALLMADMTAMDPATKEWYMEQRMLILQLRAPPPSSAPTPPPPSSTPPPSSSTPPPASSTPPAAPEVPSARDENDLAV